MASRGAIAMLLVAAALLAAAAVVDAQLSYNYYRCPQALGKIREIVQNAINSNQRTGAALVRMFFHDCFVTGCDASILLEGDGSEKTQNPNLSLTGYDVIDRIKETVDRECGYDVVSCADIIAVAARDSVAILGGPNYQVEVGRRDGKKPGNTVTLPGALDDLEKLVGTFRKYGLSVQDLVALSGAHTLGFAQCRFARQRVEDAEDEIDAPYAEYLKKKCNAPSWVTGAVVELDESPYRFDNIYFQMLLKRRGLLASDQELFQGGNSESDRLVRTYSYNQQKFFEDFTEAMQKLGRVKIQTGKKGEIRRNCRRRN